MQRGSINCPSHGSVVACMGPDGSAELVGTCPYGGELVSMVPQSLAGPFQRHWDPHHAMDAEPTHAVEVVVDLEQIVLDVAAAHAKIDALSTQVAALQEVIVAGAKVSGEMSKA